MWCNITGHLVYIAVSVWCELAIVLALEINKCVHGNVDLRVRTQRSDSATRILGRECKAD